MSTLDFLNKLNEDGAASFRERFLKATDREWLKGLASLGSVGLLLVVFYLVPMILLFLYSFTTGIDIMEFSFTLAHYERIFELSSLLALNFGELTYLNLLFKSLRVSLTVTLAALVISYPITYYIGQKAPKKYKTAMVMLVIVPFWTSYLIRTYAWIPILSQNGLINSTLSAVGLPTLQLLYTPLATTLGLVYVYVPFMILPLYASMEGLDPSLIEAAKDLGASRTRVFTEVIFPLTLPGAVAGSIFIFIKCAAAFITPTLLGGSNGILYANVIVSQFREVFNWNFGSAMSFVLLAVILLTLWLGKRSGFLDNQMTGGAP